MADWGPVKFREVLETEYLQPGPARRPAAARVAGPPRPHRHRRPAATACSRSAPPPTPAAPPAPRCASWPRWPSATAGGRVRLTAQQGVVVLDVAEADSDALADELALIGLTVRPSAFHRGTIACTGIEFCKLALVETKGRAETIRRELEKRLPDFDTPITINVNGCPNSCARFQVADIGFKGMVQKGADGDVGGLPGAPRRPDGHRRGVRAQVPGSEGHGRGGPGLRRAGAARLSRAARRRRVVRGVRQPGGGSMVAASALATGDCATLAERAGDDLGRRLGHRDPHLGRRAVRLGWCVASSMADAVVPHLASRVRPGVDVLFLDTGYHFAETIGTRDAVAATLPVTVRTITPQTHGGRAGRELRRRGSTNATPTSAAPCARCMPLRQSLSSLRRLGLGAAPRRGHHPGGRQASSSGTPAARWSSSTRSRPGPRTTSTPTSPTTACWSTRCCSTATARSAAHRAPAGSQPGEDARAGRWAGTAQDRVRPALKPAGPPR